MVASSEQTAEFFPQAQITSNSKPFSKDMEYTIMLPHLGYNALIPAQTTDMGRYYHLFMRRQYINEKSWKLFQDLEIFGIMRAVYITCINAHWNRIGDDLKMTFGLPAGAYASVVVDLLTEQLNSKLESPTDVPSPLDKEGIKGRLKKTYSQKDKVKNTASPSSS
jgi:tRNA(Glu) U13 pseudouridine synthase TruD